MKKRFYVNFLIFLFTNYVFSLNEYTNYAQNTGNLNYAVSVISKALKESPQALILSNNADVTNTTFKLQKKQWLPSIQFDLQADTNQVQGEYLFLKNKGTLSLLQTVITPSTNIGLNQALPGNGQFSIDAGYGFSLLTEQNAYIQNPYLQIGLSQRLSYGAFFLSKDPSFMKLKTNEQFSSIQNKKNAFELVIDFISTVQSYDLALLNKKYYEAVQKKALAEYKEQELRHEIGQKNDIELLRTHTKLTQAVNNFKQATQNVIQTETILSEYQIEEIKEQSNKFRDELLELLEKEYIEEQLLTFQEQELVNEISNEKLNLKENKIKMAPLLYIQTLISPNQNKNIEYSDFYASFRTLKNTPYIWTINTTVGLSIGLDYSFQKKHLKEIADKKILNLTSQLETLRNEQNKIKDSYNQWIDFFSSYCTDTKLALEKENEFLAEKHALLNRNIITEIQYLEAEVNYYEMQLNYFNSLWNLIQNKLNMLRLSSKWMAFVQEFMEI